MNEEQPVIYNSDLEVFEALLNKAGIKYELDHDDIDTNYYLIIADSYYEKMYSCWIFTADGTLHHHELGIE